MELTRKSVLRTMRKAARLGAAVFAKRHGFRVGKYAVRWKGLALPSKAILGVATNRTAAAFSGGVAHAVRVLRGLGFTVVALQRVALVACSAAKRTVTSTARDLYTGAFFRKAVRYADAKLDGFAVLSAKHGVLLPTDNVAPYNHRLGGKAERVTWTAAVLAQLAELFDTATTTFVLLAGRDYREGIEASDLTTVNPFGNVRGLGDMMSQLDRAVA